MHHKAPWSLEIILVGHYDVCAVWKRLEFFWQRFIIFSSKDHIMPLCSLHEEFHIVRKMPRQVIISPDDSIFCDRCNQRDFHSPVCKNCELVSTKVCCLGKNHRC